MCAPAHAALHPPRGWRGVSILQSQNQKTGAAWLSVVSNTILVVLKLVIGLMIGSVSVMSEAIHSGMDLLAAMIALFAVRESAKPADDDHPFGHGKVENMSGTIEALLIFAAAGWIIFEAVHKLIRPQPLEAVGWGIGVMAFSSAANMLVSHVLFRVGRKTDSIALQADAWHLRTDVYTSAGVMSGLAIIWVAEKLVPGTHFHWLDPVAAILVALLIIRAAYHLTLESASGLLDTSLPDVDEWIRDFLATQAPTVRAYHGLKTRKAGSTRFVEFHLRVAGDMSVAESHAIAHRMSAHIKQRFPGSDVTVHVEPCTGHCTLECQNDCLMNAKEREEIQRRAAGASQTPEAHAKVVQE